MKQWWGRVTMGVGLWLIGERETPAVKILRQAREIETKQYMDLCDVLNAAVIDKKTAIQQRDDWMMLHSVSDKARAEWILRYGRLRKRHDKLKSQMNKKPTKRKK